MGPLSGLSVVAHYVSPPCRTDRQTVDVGWYQVGSMQLNRKIYKVKRHWLEYASFYMLTFLPCDTMLVQYMLSCVCECVLSHQYCIKKAARIELVFFRVGFSGLVIHCVLKTLRYLQK